MLLPNYRACLCMVYVCLRILRDFYFIFEKRGKQKGRAGEIGENIKERIYIYKGVQKATRVVACTTPLSNV